MLAQGAEVAKALEVSEQTFHRWRARTGGMKADDVKRLRTLRSWLATRGSAPILLGDRCSAPQTVANRTVRVVSRRSRRFGGYG